MRPTNTTNQHGPVQEKRLRGMRACAASWLRGPPRLPPRPRRPPHQGHCVMWRGGVRSRAVEPVLGGCAKNKKIRKHTCHNSEPPKPFASHLHLNRSSVANIYPKQLREVTASCASTVSDQPDKSNIGTHTVMPTRPRQEHDCDMRPSKLRGTRM